MPSARAAVSKGITAGGFSTSAIVMAINAHHRLFPIASTAGAANLPLHDRAAKKGLQHDHKGLTVDGVVGPKTWAAAGVKPGRACCR
ncbi:peptidoglycan-binding domain-containing protein [Spongiactinospora rosea]|uniref:peptidoglycan-binding domain-containing protein n=1 Tax=Spongiactinospora rosea TaxID=2248750 RepID=UPI0018F291E2|nr:peptidoglycan-binding domain-containing protein [Spongiactinospora rosea]